MAETADNNATRALRSTTPVKSNGTMLQNIDPDHKPLELVASRISAGRAINAAQKIMNSNTHVNPSGLHHRSLSEGSSTEHHQRSRTTSKRFMEEAGNEPFQALPPYKGSELSPVNTRPASPELDHDDTEPRRRLTKTITPIPERRSSRTRQDGDGTSRDAKHQDTEDGTSHSRYGPRASEIEAARRILAEAEKIGYHVPPRKTYKQPSVRTGRATPPPIGRGRLYIKDDYEDTYTETETRPPTPEVDSMVDEERTRRPLSRNYKQTNTSAHVSQPLRRSRSHQEEPRTPVLNHLQLSEGSTLVPSRSRNPEGPRSYDGGSDVFDRFDEGNRTFPRGGTSVSNSEEQAFLKNASRARDYLRNTSLTGNTEYGEFQRHGAGDSGDYRPVAGPRSTFSDETHSVTRRTITAGGQSIRSHESSSRLPDFFSYSIFQIVLRNPATAHQLLKFSEIRLCNENIEFLSKVEEYQKILTDLANVIATIHKGFISDQASNQINLPGHLLRSVHTEMKSLLATTFPGMETLFTAAQERIEELVFTDVYQRFVRFQITLSATRALASDRHRYQGLGDCFCLTNPNKADNPIVFASDGFVKVTGYGRPEIIPRNCRFLQGSHTDRVPIRRLKKGIDECKETVELILNYKKNGDPFWNLLYVAPLYNENGSVAFFIGGQVNCSTTIHSNADVMRVLSMSSSADADDDAKPVPAESHAKQSTLPSARKALLKAFGVHVQEPKPVLSVSGMERQVLDRMEGQNLDAQMKEFYTAYSKYLVVRADTFVVRFYSEGVLDVLNPANNTGLVVGQDIFHFFKQNMVGKDSDYRTRVRSAVRAGNPVSLELRLQTLRSARFRGDERFVTHWTPLKDENAAPHWVVVTLASTVG